MAATAFEVIAARVLLLKWDNESGRVVFNKAAHTFKGCVKTQALATACFAGVAGITQLPGVAELQALSSCILGIALIGVTVSQSILLTSRT